VEDVVRILERDALRNIPLLKHLQAFPDEARAYCAQSRSGFAVLVLLKSTATSYDRLMYPKADYSAFIASDHPALTAEVLDHVPDGAAVVFKLSNDRDREVVAAKYTLEKGVRFLSFTTSSEFSRDPSAALTNTPSEAAFRAFEELGHARSWLIPLLRSDRAFVVELCGDEQLLAACFAFQNYGPIWEIGGVRTSPGFRRQGHASRVVRTALAELGRRRRVPRYQADAENKASVGLANAIGLRLFLSLAHFTHRPSKRADTMIA